MRALSHVGVESREAYFRLQLPPSEHAARFRIPEIARTLRPPARRAHCDLAEVRQRAMADDGSRVARGLDSGLGCEESCQHGLGGRSHGRGGDCMNTTAKPTPPPAAPEAQESYIVTEGKKRGSTRDVRPEAAFDRYYTVLRVHAGDTILTDNWHTKEVLEHTRSSFEGYT